MNGYEPERRPWMALVEIKQGKRASDIGQCGGSILNKVFLNYICTMKRSGITCLL